MPAHSRSKNGVASPAYVAGIHDFGFRRDARRGWPGQARPWRPVLVTTGLDPVVHAEL